VRRRKRHFWRPEENRVADKYARLLGEGRYRSASEAAAPCLAELRRLACSKRRGAHLPKSVGSHLYSLARKAGLRWGVCHWNRREAAVALEFAGKVVAGSYSTVHEAARDCLEELERLNARGLRSVGTHAAGDKVYSLESVYTRLRKLTLGQRPPVPPDWTASETRVVNRYLRDVYRGVYPDARSAAQACTRELAQMASSGSAPGAGAAGGRTSVAVYAMMSASTMRLNLPRRKGKLAAWESRLAERYARAVKDGEYSDCLEAARACAKELRRRNAKVGGASPLAVKRLAGRPLHGIHARILAAAHRFGLHSNPHWTAAEKKVLEGWVRWYDSHPGTRRRTRALSQAAAGLQEELERMDSQRSIPACIDQLLCGRQRLYGVA